MLRPRARNGGPSATVSPPVPALPLHEAHAANRLPRPAGPGPRAPGPAPLSRDRSLRTRAGGPRAQRRPTRPRAHGSGAPAPDGDWARTVTSLRAAPEAAGSGPGARRRVAGAGRAPGAPLRRLAGSAALPSRRCQPRPAARPPPAACLPAPPVRGPGADLKSPVRGPRERGSQSAARTFPAASARRRRPRRRRRRRAGGAGAGSAPRARASAWPRCARRRRPLPVWALTPHGPGPLLACRSGEPPAEDATHRRSLGRPPNRRGPPTAGAGAGRPGCGRPEGRRGGPRRPEGAGVPGGLRAPRRPEGPAQGMGDREAERPERVVGIGGTARTAEA